MKDFPSAFAGMAVMLISLPLPGMVARAMQSMQKNMMKAMDARVQTVSESTNTLFPKPSTIHIYRSDGCVTNGQGFWLGAKNEREGCGEAR
jgi:hypothetical protein